MRRAFLIILLAAAVCAPSVRAGRPQATQSSSSKALAAVIDSLERRQPEGRGAAGARGPADDPSLSLAAAERLAGEAKQVLAQLDFRARYSASTHG
jgi:Flp pilus assembly protein TadD